MLSQKEEKRLASYARRYNISAEDTAWQSTAAEFAAHVLRDRVRDADRTGAFPNDWIPALGANGLIGASLASEAGGRGASPLADCLIAEEIGAVCGSVRGFLAVQGGLVVEPMAHDAPPDVKQAWLKKLIDGAAIGAFALTEVEAGSDVGAIQTRVNHEGSHVVIDGEKTWITNGGIADVLLVFGSVDPERRTKGLECYAVAADTPGISRTGVEGRELGHRASDHARIRFENVRVPVSHRVGPALGGFHVAMRGLRKGRLNVAAGAVGIQRACLDLALQHTRTRRQFGKRLGDFQQVGAALAEMHVSLEASRQLVHHAASLRGRGEDDAAAVSAAKLFATERALQTTTTALQLHGNRGYTDALPVERHYRDAIALTIYEGTSHIQRVILARELLGKDPA